MQSYLIDIDLSTLTGAFWGWVEEVIGWTERALAISREIGDRRGEGTHCWNFGLAFEKQGRYAEAAELMQIRIDYEREIGHPDAEPAARRLDEVRRKAEMDVG